MNIKMNIEDNNACINNLAFVRALLIKKKIDNLEIEYQEKEQVLEEVLKYLKEN